MQNSVTSLFNSLPNQNNLAMTNKIKILFWFKRNSKGNKDKGAVWCRVTLNKERIEIGSTNLCSSIKDWNSETQRFRTSLSSHQQNNFALSNIHNDLMNIYLSYESQKKKLTPQLLKSIYRGETRMNPYFKIILEKFLNEKTELVASSKVSYRNRCRNFERFCVSAKMPNIEVNEVTPKFVNRFYAWLLVEGYKKSYSGKAKQAIKTVLSWAYEHEYISENPLTSYKVKIDRSVNTEHLTVEELNRIINYQFDDSLQQVADCFVFCCCTGLEYSGIKSLSIKNNIITEDNRLCLSAERLKTGVERFVPLNDVAIRLINKYRLHGYFPVKSNKFMNAALKVIALHVEIEKRLYWHIARKTFADHCLNERNMSIEATVKAMGQSNLNSIKPYAKLDKRRVLSEFK
jgi:integrase/recombinase XerD